MGKKHKKWERNKKMAHYNSNYSDREATQAIVTVPAPIKDTAHLDKILNLKHIPDLDMFRIYMQTDWEQFAKLKFEQVVINNRRYLYRDNGANILGVAHVDVVKQDKIFITEGNRIYAPQLDDRLGIWSLLYSLPIALKSTPYDVLLCDDEEIGQSTASLFKTDKKYNWIFEIDRADSDSVMYQYETEKYRQLLIDHGFEVGWGTFTDICELDELGCLGINFACGYHDQHSLACYVDTDIYTSQLDLIINFIEKNKDTLYEHDPETGRKYRQRSYYGSYYYGSSSVYGTAWDDDSWYASSTNSGVVEKTEEIVIIDCLHCGREAFVADIYCDHCGNILPTTVNKCEICQTKECQYKGLIQCKLCLFHMHGDLFVDNLGVCRDCLFVVYNIPTQLLDAFEASEYLNTVEQMTLILREEMGKLV